MDFGYGKIYVQCASHPIRIAEHCRLFVAVCQLAATKSQRVQIKESKFDGLVTTSWDVSIIGGISGLLFFAELDSQWGTTAVTFIVRESDLAEAAKLGCPVVGLDPFDFDADAATYEWN